MKFFWNALRSFSAREKAAFLRFVYGQSRLPTSHLREKFGTNAGYLLALAPHFTH